MYMCFLISKKFQQENVSACEASTILMECYNFDDGAKPKRIFFACSFGSLQHELHIKIGIPGEESIVIQIIN